MDFTHFMFLTWYLTWCGCTTGTSLDFRTCGNIVNLVASGFSGLDVHEEIHLVSSYLVQMCLERVYSQGSVATQLRRGGMFNNHCTTNFS